MLRNQTVWPRPNNSNPTSNVLGFTIIIVIIIIAINIINNRGTTRCRTVTLSMDSESGTATIASTENTWFWFGWSMHRGVLEILQCPHDRDVIRIAHVSMIQSEVEAATPLRRQMLMHGSARD